VSRKITPSNDENEQKTRRSAIAEKAASSLLRCLDYRIALVCSRPMLTMAIPDVKILAIHLFTVCVNVFARWQQRVWSKIKVCLRIKSCKIVF